MKIVFAALAMLATASGSAETLFERTLRTCGPACVVPPPAASKPASGTKAQKAANTPRGDSITLKPGDSIIVIDSKTSQSKVCYFMGGALVC